MRITMRDRAMRYAVLAIATGTAFLVAYVLYRTGTTVELDREVIHRVREVRAPWLDALGVFDDVAFRPTGTFIAALFLTILLWRFGPPWSWLAPPFFLVVAGAELILKIGVGTMIHPRAMLDAILVLVGGHLHVGATFPSGHVARAIFLGVIVLAFLPRVVSIPLALLAASTIYARMYTESHRLTDVLGGAAMGACIASVGIAAVAFIAPRLRPRRVAGTPPSQPPGLEPHALPASETVGIGRRD